MKKLLISGAKGRMGQMIASQAAGHGFTVVGGIDRAERLDGDFPIVRDFSRVEADADALIDFSAPMMLGSLLGSMFGMGSGLFADILGLLMNVVLIGAVFMIGRLLWNKLRGRNSGAGTNPYRSQAAAPRGERREDVIDVTPRRSADSSYDSKRKADEYRNR